MAMRRVRAIGAAIGALAVCSASFGQSNGRYEFEFDRLVVSPANPSVTMTVYAAWDQAFPGEFVFGNGSYDLVASSGEFSSAALVLGQNPPSRAGQINGNRIEGAVIGQLHLPGTALGNPDDPIALGEYVWTTSDFTARSIDFVTEYTTTFYLVPEAGGQRVHLVPGEFTPGFGAITVVPGPAAVITIGAGSFLAILRRRRSA